MRAHFTASHVRLTLSDSKKKSRSDERLFLKELRQRRRCSVIPKPLCRLLLLLWPPPLYGRRSHCINIHNVNFRHRDCRKWRSSGGDALRQGYCPHGPLPIHPPPWTMNSCYFVCLFVRGIFYTFPGIFFFFFGVTALYSCPQQKVPVFQKVPKLDNYRGWTTIGGLYGMLLPFVRWLSLRSDEMGGG